MPGEQRQTQTTNQSSTTRPWDIATQPLTDLLNRFSGLGNETNTTLDSAYANMYDALGQVPNFGPDATRGIGRMYQTDTTGQIDMMNRGFNSLNERLGGLASGAELDPYKTPGFSDAISTMTGDITDKIKGLYAGSGRDPSGAGSFAGSLGRGLTEGIAPVIQNQFNQNNANRINAANQLFNAAGSTAQGTTALGQVPLENIARAIGLSGQLPGLYTGSSAARLALANAQNDRPWQQASRWLQGVLPIASLGSQTQGTSNTDRVQEESTVGNILGGGLGLASLFSGGANSAISGLGSALGGLGSFLGFSDERVKENIAEVGETHDGQPIYFFNYIGDNAPRMGLMAQDVEKVKPDAVHEVGGIKMVDYGKALGLYKEAA